MDSVVECLDFDAIVNTWEDACMKCGMKVSDEEFDESHITLV